MGELAHMDFNIYANPLIFYSFNHVNTYWLNCKHTSSQ